MHSTAWSGIGANGRLDRNASSDDLFIGHSPNQLWSVLEDVTFKVQQRYQASLKRLAAAYPCGESTTSYELWIVLHTRRCSTQVVYGVVHRKAHARTAHRVTRTEDDKIYVPTNYSVEVVGCTLNNAVFS